MKSQFGRRMITGNAVHFGKYPIFHLWILFVSGLVLPSQATPPSNLPVDLSNRSDVADFYRKQLVPIVPGRNWNGEYLSGNPGVSPEGYRASLITRLNALRALAGVPPLVRENLELSRKCQQAALMMSANAQFTHFPPPSLKFYTADAAEAALHSNLESSGSSDAIMVYLEDVFSPDAGQRRAILNPALTEAGIGWVPEQHGAADEPYYSGASVLWLSNSTSAFPARDGYVAWPPPGFVPRDLAVSDVWSFDTFGNVPNADLSDSTVSIRRNNELVPVEIAHRTSTSVVWTVPESKQRFDPRDEVCIVTISAPSLPTSITYRVVLFDPASDGEENVVLPPPFEIVAPSNSGSVSRVIAAGGKLFGAGKSGLLLARVAGRGWARAEIDSTETISAVAFGAHQYVASAGTKVFVSLDGLEWSPALAASVPSLSDLCYGAGVFVGTAPFAGIVRSANGDEWTKVASVSDVGSPAAVTFGQGVFVAVGYSGVILKSVDGEHWNKMTNPAGMGSLLNVVFAQGRFVAVGPHTILSSLNGEAWELVESDDGALFKGLTYGPGGFAVTGATGQAAGGKGASFILLSVDGAGWDGQRISTVPEISATVELPAHTIASFDGKFFVSDDAGAVQSSADLSSWRLETERLFAMSASIAFGSQTFVALDCDGTVFTSDIGRQWRKIADAGLSKPFSGAWCNAPLIWASGQFIATAPFPGLYTSADGSHWTRRVSSGFDHLAVLSDGYLATRAASLYWSTNLTDWKKTLDGGSAFTALCGGPGLNLAANSSGAIYRSLDGQSWEKVEGAIESWILDCVYGNGEFLALTGGGLMRSIDGKDWQALSTGGDLERIFFSGNQFYGVRAGAISGSQNGELWSDTRVGAPIHDLAAGNNRLVALGPDGTVLRSAPDPRVGFQNPSRPASLTWQSLLDFDYEIRYSDDLQTWISLPGLVSGTGGVVSMDLPSSVAEKRFYQLREVEKR